MGEPAYKNKRYTWSDYQQLPDDERWEIIGGEIFDMSPAPSMRHQSIAGELFRQMANHLHGKPCNPFIAPADLKLSDEDVVQPDLMVVCDQNQIKESHVEGAPALVVEILSPSTQGHDRKRKMALYARAGVKEVWLVSPLPPGIEVFLLDGATYRFMEPSEYARFKKLKRENLRDHMNDLELIFSMLGEAATTEITRTRDAQEFLENKEAAQDGGKVAGNARRELEKESGRKVSSRENYIELPQSIKNLSKDNDHGA